MTFLGCPSPDPFNTPLVEALPLADKPHILQPNSRKEELFGMPRQPIVTSTQQDTTDAAGIPPPLQPSPFDRLPTHLALSMRTVDTPFAHGAPLPPVYPPPPSGIPTSTAAVEVPPCAVMETQVSAF